MCILSSSHNAELISLECSIELYQKYNIVDCMTSGLAQRCVQLNKHKLTILVLNMFTQVDALTSSIVSINLGQIRLQPNSIITEAQVNVLSSVGEIGSVATEIT